MTLSKFTKTPQNASKPIIPLSATLFSNDPLLQIQRNLQSTAQTRESMASRPLSEKSHEQNGLLFHSPQEKKGLEERELGGGRAGSASDEEFR